MKKKTNRFGCSILLSAVLLGILSGCGGKQTSQTESAETGMAAPSSQVTSTPTTPESLPEELPAESVITVSNAEELIKAITPGAEIKLEAGYYDLSEYLQEVWEQEGESWNDQQTCLAIRECFDGVELVIRNVNGLTLCGSDEAMTEIVIEPRYGTVISFEDCQAITLSDLTIGHTEQGECTGNVLGFFGCSDITMERIDLYGCGYLGISAADSGGFTVNDSLIRDCSGGPLEIIGGKGKFTFTGCTLRDSDGFGYYEKTDESELLFSKCTFGDNETSYYMFHEDIYTEDCIWSENYLYPDVEPEYP